MKLQFRLKIPGTGSAKKSLIRHPTILNPWCNKYPNTLVDVVLFYFFIYLFNRSMDRKNWLWAMGENIFKCWKRPCGGSLSSHSIQQRCIFIDLQTLTTMESSSFFFYSHMHRTMFKDSISLIPINKYGNEEPFKKKRGNPCPDTPGGFCHSGCCQLPRANGSVIHLNIHQSIEWKFPRHFFYLSGVTTSAALAKFFLFLFTALILVN